MRPLIDDEQGRARGGTRPVGLRVVRHLVAHARSEMKPAAIGQLGLELAGNAEQDVPLAAPVVRLVPRRIFDQPHADGAEVPGAPARQPDLAGVLDRLDPEPVGDAERDVRELHRDPIPPNSMRTTMQASRSVWLCCAALINLSVAPAAGQGSSTSGPTTARGADPFLWLEQLEGPRALKWVHAENARTLAVLQADQRFASFYDDALKIGEAQDRLPLPRIIGGQVYNFWQDQQHVRGIWRTTSRADYAARQPAWSTVLDLDALASAEGKNWIWQGADCDSPSRQRCLISLSEGGEDAATIREFDLRTGRFVEGGFRLPRGKQGAAWAGDDRLLVAREWSPGQLTSSGYPFVVKSLERGKPLSSATEVYRGSKADVGDWPFAFTDGQGHRAVGVSRGLSFFESENYLITPAGLRKLGLPLKSNPQGLLKNQLWIRLAEDWTAGGTRFTAGSLVSVDLSRATARPERLEASTIYVPGSRETYDGAVATEDALVVRSEEHTSE